MISQAGLGIRCITQSPRPYPELLIQQTDRLGDYEYHVVFCLAVEIGGETGVIDYRDQFFYDDFDSSR